MILTTLGRILKFGFQNFKRNFWLSLVTVFILVLTLFSISVVFTLNVVADNAIKSVKDQVNIDVFFDPTVPEDKVVAVQAYLESISEVKNVEYISKEHALENFKEAHKDDLQIQESLSEIEENPLPSALVVKAFNLEDYSSIVVKLDNSEYSDLIASRNFEDNQIVIERLTKITDRIYQFGIGVSAIFILVAILVVFNTLRMNMYTQREELGIMRLVGAQNMFIRLPFVLESVLYGILASVITILILFPLLSAVSPYIDTLFEGYDFNMFAYFTANFWAMLGLQILISIVISVISGMIAISRYLRV
ncbi:MAG: permease-like cell division protein FtsX [Patescibacteria group bacterium]|jgi:cell division transport system permease protein